VGKSGELSPSFQKLFRRLGEEHKNVARGRFASRKKNSIAASEIQGSPGMREEDGPASWAEYERDGHAGTEYFRIRIERAVGHGVSGAAAVEWMAAFAKAEERAGTGVKTDCSSCRVERELLAKYSLRIANGDTPGFFLELNFVGTPRRNVFRI